MKKSRLQSKGVLCAALTAALLTNAVPLAAIAASPVYQDGTYTGTAEGRNGDVTVSVTVSGGVISAIDVTDQAETPSFWESAQEIIPEIIKANTTEGVDAVSGATLSSSAIKNAVGNALAGSTSSGIFASGTGSASDPYVIETAAQLADFANSVDGGENYQGKYIALHADLDLSGMGNWNPIGAEGAAAKNLNCIFAGTFDGQGHTIKGLTIKTDSPYTEEQNVGLFSTILSTARATGIRLADAVIDVTGEKVVRAGGITGDITSNAVSGTEGTAAVDRCSVTGSISVKADAGMAMTGGIAGRAAGNAVLSNCVSDAAVNSASGSKIAYGAGIAAMTGNDTYVVNCANSGDITVTTTTGFSLYAGGVVGMMTSEQYNCFSTGNVTVGTIAQSDAANGAGILNGALMPAASGMYDYSASDAQLFYLDEAGTKNAMDSVAHGAGSMHAEGSFAPEAITKESANSADFVNTLNKNLYAVSRILHAKKIDTDLKRWARSETGNTVLSDETFVNDVIDASLFAGGNGSQESPYQIQNADQLRAFAGSLSEHIDYSGTFIALTDDIDLSGTEWTPIGNSTYAFNGTFDGNGHTISGMTIGSATDAKALAAGENYLGLFSVLNTNAVVRNVKLTGVLINVTYNASAYAGGIAAAMNSDDTGYKGAVVDNCTVDGSITVTAETGNNFVGGIAAYVYKGAIINCKTDVNASCTVKTGGFYGETGGIAALVNRGLVANSYSLGNVFGSGKREDEGMAVISSLVAVNAG